METRGFVVPPGGGKRLDMAPGRFSALKLLGGETADSIMMFEETAPVGSETTYHLHHDSEEVAYVLAGEGDDEDRRRDHRRQGRLLCLFSA